MGKKTHQEAHDLPAFLDEANTRLWQHLTHEVPELIFQRMRVGDSDAVLKTCSPHTNKLVCVFALEL